RNPEDGEILHDAAGEPNGLLRGAASKLVLSVIPPPPYAQRKAEAVRALQKSGELTSRVWGRMWLSEWERERDYIKRNAVPAVVGGWGDDMIRLGGLKAWVDGIMGNSTALFFEPYKSAPDSYGRL